MNADVKKVVKKARKSIEKVESPKKNPLHIDYPTNMFRGQSRFSKSPNRVKRTSL